MKIQRDTVSSGKEASPFGGAGKAIVERNYGTIAGPRTTGETNESICLKVTMAKS